MAVIKLTVNGREREVDTAPTTTLLSVLRNKLRLRGAKHGCSAGYCGACTVLLDGEPVKPCLLPITAAKGKEILTIEGVREQGVSPALQKAFDRISPYQCGFCTHGMMMTAVGLLGHKPKPRKREIEQALTKNKCNCGEYPRMVDAVKSAATK